MSWPQSTSCFRSSKAFDLTCRIWEETSCFATPCCPTLAPPPSSAMGAWCERCMPSVTTRQRSITEVQCMNVVWTQQLCHFQMPLQYDSQNLWYVCADRTKTKKDSKHPCCGRNWCDKCGKICDKDNCTEVIQKCSWCGEGPFCSYEEVSADR